MSSGVEVERSVATELVGNGKAGIIRKKKNKK